MPLTESVTIPLTSFHRVQFARWEADVQSAITKRAVGVETLVATVMDPRDAEGCSFTITDAGLVLAPKAE